MADLYSVQHIAVLLILLLLKLKPPVEAAFTCCNSCTNETGQNKHTSLYM